MNTYTIKLTRKQIDELYTSLKPVSINKTPPYALYQVKMSDCTITAYESLKVVFQGTGASFYASPYMDTNQERKQTRNTYPQCGSDEVGTGDYFGPVVVCALRVEPKDEAWLKNLPIHDSKALKDEVILKVAPTLMQHLTYSILVLQNDKYNTVQKTNNMNMIKAKLHNQAYIHLQNKVNTPLENIIVDQFAPEKLYYSYLSDEPTVVKGIHFETKAESKYISVACASIIARYTFLEVMDKMGEQFEFTFLKGAGSKVDENGVEFVQKHSYEALSKVAKLHFKNTEKIQNLLK